MRLSKIIFLAAYKNGKSLSLDQPQASIEFSLRLVNVSGNAMPVTENIIYGIAANMRAAGLSEAEIKEAIAYQNQKFEVARTGKSWGQFQAKIAELQNKNAKWLTTYAGVPKSLDDLQYFWKIQFSYDRRIWHAD